MADNNLGAYPPELQVGIKVEHNAQVPELQCLLNELSNELNDYGNCVGVITTIVFALKPITETEQIPLVAPPCEGGLIGDLRAEIFILKQLNRKLQAINGHMNKIVG